MAAKLEQPFSIESELANNRVDARESKKYYLTMTHLRRATTPLILGAFRLLSCVRIDGAEQVPADGPVVLAANHLTNFDVLPLQMAINPRPIFFMGKEQLFRNQVVDWGLRQFGGFPVYRGANDEWAMRHAAKVLQHGQVLGIFPEGTRNKGKGLNSAKTGAARLALDAGCPILPVGLHGPQYLFKKISRRTPIQVTIGEPIRPEAGESVLNLTDRLMFALADLLPHGQRGVYGYRPKGF